MLYRIAFVAALAGSASALPNFLRIRQGVTQEISPDAPAPAGFVTSLPGPFGISAMNITDDGTPAPTGADIGGAPATQISEYVITLDSCLFVSC